MVQLTNHMIWERMKTCLDVIVTNAPQSPLASNRCSIKSVRTSIQDHPWTRKESSLSLDPLAFLGTKRYQRKESASNRSLELRARFTSRRPTLASWPSAWWAWRGKKDALRHGGSTPHTLPDAATSCPPGGHISLLQQTFGQGWLLFLWSMFCSELCYNKTFDLMNSISSFYRPVPRSL